MFGQGAHRLVSERFKEFIELRVNPGAAERDAKDEPLSRELLREAAAVGLLGLTFPEEVGGEGMDYGTYGTVLERVGYFCSDLSFPSLMSLYPDVARMIFDSGREELISHYVEPMCRGERFGCFAYTEDADAFHFATRASRRSDGSVVLEGQKSMQTGGLSADCFLTYVADAQSRDLMVVLVDRDDAGVTVAPVPCLGMRSAGISTLTLDGVVIPAERVLVTQDGLSHAQRFLNTRRIFLICGGCGLLEAMLEECVRELGRTNRYGKSVLDLQNVQASIGRLYVQMEATRALLFRALEWLHLGRHDPHFDRMISAAKYFGVEQSLHIVEQLLRLLGGKSYTMRLPFQRYLRDFHGGLMGGGTQDILEINLGVEVISAIERSLRKDALQ